jgi:hypothetical protein
MKNIAIGLRDLGGCGTLLEVSLGIWSHSHIKLDAQNIKLGEFPVTDSEDLLGPGSQCCFFMTGQQSTESFYCGRIIRILPAPLENQTRYRIEFQLLKLTIKAHSIPNFEGLMRGQHHVYY